MQYYLLKTKNNETRDKCPHFSIEKNQKVSRKLSLWCYYFNRSCIYDTDPFRNHTTLLIIKNKG